MGTEEDENAKRNIFKVDLFDAKKKSQKDGFTDIATMTSDCTGRYSNHGGQVRCDCDDEAKNMDASSLDSRRPNPKQHIEDLLLSLDKIIVDKQISLLGSGECPSGTVHLLNNTAHSVENLQEDEKNGVITHSVITEKVCNEPMSMEESSGEIERGSMAALSNEDAVPMQKSTTDQASMTSSLPSQADLDDRSAPCHRGHSIASGPITSPLKNGRGMGIDTKEKEQAVMSSTSVTSANRRPRMIHNPNRRRHSDGSSKSVSAWWKPRPEIADLLESREITSGLLHFPAGTTCAAVGKSKEPVQMHSPSDRIEPDVIVIDELEPQGVTSNLLAPESDAPGVLMEDSATCSINGLRATPKKSSPSTNKTLNQVKKNVVNDDVVTCQSDTHSAGEWLKAVEAHVSNSSQDILQGNQQIISDQEQAQFPYQCNLLVDELIFPPLPDFQSQHEGRDKSADPQFEAAETYSLSGNASDKNHLSVSVDRHSRSVARKNNFKRFHGSTNISGKGRMTGHKYWWLIDSSSSPKDERKGSAHEMVGGDAMSMGKVLKAKEKNSLKKFCLKSKMKSTCVKTEAISKKAVSQGCARKNETGLQVNEQSSIQSALLEELAEHFHVDRSIVGQARKLLHRAWLMREYATHVKLGRSRKILAAVCILSACRQAGLHFTFHELSSFLGVRHMEVGRHYKMLVRHLGLNPSFTSLVDYVSRFSSLLGLTEGDREVACRVGEDLSGKQIPSRLGYGKNLGFINVMRAASIGVFIATNSVRSTSNLHVTFADIGRMTGVKSAGLTHIFSHCFTQVDETSDTLTLCGPNQCHILRKHALPGGTTPNCRSGSAPADETARTQDKIQSQSDRPAVNQDDGHAGPLPEKGGLRPVDCLLQTKHAQIQEADNASECS